MRFPFLLCASLVFLTGCYDKQERAQEHFESALALFDDGDDARAMVELRNVLQNDGQHFEGRKLIAETLLAQGDMEGAYAQYLRLIEQYPDTVEIRRLLAELSLDTGNRREFERHSAAAIEMDPSLPAHQALGLMQTYFAARQSNDDITAAQTAEDALALLAANPELDTALRLLVDWHATGPDPASALPYIDNLLSRHPSSHSLMMARVRTLQAAGRDEDVGETLRALHDLAPDDEQIASMLLTWFVSRDDLAAAETFLRARAGADDSPADGHLNVVDFLAQTRGIPTALAELDRLQQANGETDLGLRYAAQAAAIRFETGETRDPAAMADIVEKITDIGIKNDAQIVLANMYRVLGDPAKVEALNDEVLARDPSHVEALVIRGSFHLRDNDPSSAVSDLRTVLDQAPRNTAALLLLANAHQLLGNVALAEQRLAQAVEFSDAAPQSAIPFAQFQIRRGNLSAADRVLNDSLANVFSVEAADLRAQILLQQGNMDAARNLVAQLANSTNPDANALARSLQVNILFNENQIEDSLSFLRNTLDEDGDGTDDLGTELQLLRIQMLTGRFDEAHTQLSALRDRFPDSEALPVIEANLLSMEGRTEDAIALFEAALETDPDQLIAIQRLYGLLQQTGDADAASALLQSSLARQPDARPLILLRALEQEQARQYEAALANYAALYAADPTDLVVINNYASMLAYYTDDADSLALADRISGPLKGSIEPAFLDTLGYIQLRQGALDDAILNFVTAARALPENPTLAFNLATAYAQSGRVDEARNEFERGFDLAQGLSIVPKLDEARTLYATLLAANDG